MARGKPKDTSGPRPALLRRGDLLVAGIVLLAAAALLIDMRLLSRPGASAVVTTPGGSFTLALDSNTTRELTGRDGIRVALRVHDGKIRFDSSGCPDKLCVHTGWLSRSGQSAACLPAGIAVRIEGGESPIDAVAG